MFKYPEKEEIIKMKDYLNLDISKSSPNQYIILYMEYIIPEMIHLSKIYKTDKKNIPILIVSALFSEMNIALQYYQKLLNICIEHKIYFLSAIHFLMGQEFSELQRIKKNKIFIANDSTINYYNKSVNLTQENFVKLIYNQISKISDSKENELPIAENNKTYQKILNNSYVEIKKRIENNLYDIILPLDQQNIKFSFIEEELDNIQTDTIGILDNKMALSKIKQDNHYLSCLKKDKLEITDDNKLVFSNYTQGFSLGYTDKAIILSLDKHSTIRELRTNLKYLKKYNSNHESILLTNNLIKFLEQNKSHSNYIPFKALSKQMGISKNIVKRFAKETIGINETSFIKNFDTLKNYTK